ncbi:hypothetical protein NMT12_20127 [metagenome]
MYKNIHQLGDLERSNQVLELIKIFSLKIRSIQIKFKNRQE